jgi:hypothetical protein
MTPPPEDKPDSQIVAELIRRLRREGSCFDPSVTRVEAIALSNILSFTIAGEGDLTKVHEVARR